MSSFIQEALLLRVALEALTVVLWALTWLTLAAFAVYLAGVSRTTTGQPSRQPKRQTDEVVRLARKQRTA